jgi:hypothetical protein
MGVALFASFESLLAQARSELREAPAVFQQALTLRHAWADSAASEDE